MTLQCHPRLVARLRSLAGWASVTAFVVGCFVCIGWALDIAVFKNILPGWASMKPTTALGFMLAGAALWFSRADSDEQSQPASRFIGRACAGLVVLLGLWTVGEYSLNWNDQLRSKEPPAPAATPSPGHMEPTTALSFILLGTSFLLLDVEVRHRVRPAQVLGLMAALISWVETLGYVYGAKPLAVLGPYPEMALHTAVGFLVLSLGSLFSRPDRGVMATFTSANAGGAMARRMLPAAILIPAALGGLRMWAHRAGVHEDPEAGVALLMVATMVVFGGFIWLNARWLYRADIRRKRAEEQLSRYAAELRQKNEQMEEDLKLARELQLALLPQTFPAVPHDALPRESALRFFSFYCPTGSVSGDYFDVLPLSDTAVGMFICDVMGHGVRAALVTAMVRALVQDLSPLAGDPGELLTGINHGLIGVLRQTGTLMYATAFYVVVDVARGRLLYSNAGHPSPLHLHRPAGQIEAVQRNGNTGPALGLFENAIYSTCERPMRAGDLLLLFTDGLFEVEGPGHELYSRERFLEAVRRRILLDPDVLLQDVVAEVKDFSIDKEFADYVCLIGTEVKRLF